MLVELIQWNLFDADLLLVVFAAGADPIRVGQGAAEHTLKLVEAAVIFAELVVFTDVFAYVKKLPHLHISADLFEAFALKTLN